MNPEFDSSDWLTGVSELADEELKLFSSVPGLETPLSTNCDPVSPVEGDSTPDPAEVDDPELDDDPEVDDDDPGVDDDPEVVDDPELESEVDNDPELDDDSEVDDDPEVDDDDPGVDNDPELDDDPELVSEVSETGCEPPLADSLPSWPGCGPIG